MPKSRLLLSASGVLTGALLFARLARFRPNARLRRRELRPPRGHQSHRADDVGHPLQHHQAARVDRAARHDPRRHPERQHHHPSRAGVYPKRQLRQGPGRRDQPDHRRRADFERPLSARYAQRHNPRRAHDELAPLRRPRCGADRHRQRRVILEGRAIHLGRRRQSRGGGAEPAGLLRSVASGRSNRATAFCPLLLAGRGDSRPLLLVLDTQRRPARLDPVRNRHARRTGRRHRRQRFRHQPDRTDRAGGAARRPADFRDRSRRRRPPPRLQRAHLARPTHSRLRDRHPVPFGPAERHAAGPDAKRRPDVDRHRIVACRS